MKVETILTTKGGGVFTITPDKTLKQAARVLDKNRIGALVVVDKAGAVVGILSERDIIRYSAHHTTVFDVPVSKAMTKSVVMGSPDDDVKSVMQTMTAKRFRHLPIVEQGKLVGMISIGDLLKELLNKSQGELHRREIQVMED